MTIKLRLDIEITRNARRYYRKVGLYVLCKPIDRVLAEICGEVEIQSQIMQGLYTTALRSLQAFPLNPVVKYMELWAIRL